MLQTIGNILHLFRPLFPEQAEVEFVLEFAAKAGTLAQVALVGEAKFEQELLRGSIATAHYCLDTV